MTFSQPRPSDEPPFTTPESDPATETAYNRFEEKYGRADTSQVIEKAPPSTPHDLLVADAKRKFLTQLEVWWSRQRQVDTFERRSTRKWVSDEDGALILRHAANARALLGVALDEYIDMKIAQRTYSGARTYETPADRSEVVDPVRNEESPPLEE